MSTTMDDVKQLISSLPNESSIENIQYHLYVLEKIRRGQTDIKNGKSYTTEQAKERMRKWIEL